MVGRELVNLCQYNWLSSTSSSPIKLYYEGFKLVLNSFKKRGKIAGFHSKKTLWKELTHFIINSNFGALFTVTESKAKMGQNGKIPYVCFHKSRYEFHVSNLKTNRCLDLLYLSIFVFYLDFQNKQFQGFLTDLSKVSLFHTYKKHSSTHFSSPSFILEIYLKAFCMHFYHLYLVLICCFLKQYFIKSSKSVF